MSILTKLFAPRHDDLSAPTCPGGWIAQARNGSRTANLMLQLDTATLAINGFKHGLPLLPPTCEVRMGVLSRAAQRDGLDAWVASHKVPALAQVAEDSAAHLAKEGLREVCQYLWLVAPIAPGASQQAMAAILEDLATHGRAFSSLLGVSCAPVEDCQSVASTYAPLPAASQGQLPRSAACTFAPVYPDWTGYLQNACEPLDHARMTVPALGQQPHLSFTVWVTVTKLSRSACSKASRELSSSMKRLFSRGPLEHRYRLRLAADQGQLVCVQYQLTLHHCAERSRQQAIAAFRRWGLDFREEASGFLGRGRVQKSFWATEDALDACCPLEVVPESRLDHGGLLLRTENGTSLTFDPFNSNTGHNVMVTGDHEAGMGVLCRSLLSAHIAQGQPAWLVCDEDSADDAGTLVDLLGGHRQVLDLSSSGLNPLAMCRTEQDVHDMLHWLVSLITPVLVELPVSSLARLAQASSLAWQTSPGAVSLSQICRALEQLSDDESRRLAQALARYTRDDAYAGLFSGEPLDLSTESLLVLDTSAFAAANEPLLTLTLLAMLNLHWKHMRPDQRKLACVDVADTWMHVDYQLTAAAGLVRAIWRQARMQNGALVTTVPYTALADGGRPPVIQTIAECSSWHVLMQVPQHAWGPPCLGRDLDYSTQVAALWQQARTYPPRRPGIAKFALVSSRGATLLNWSPGRLQYTLHTADITCRKAYLAARQAGTPPLAALVTAKE